MDIHSRSIVFLDFFLVNMLFFPKAFLVNMLGSVSCLLGHLIMATHLNKSYNDVGSTGSCKKLIMQSITNSILFTSYKK